MERSSLHDKVTVKDKKQNKKKTVKSREEIAFVCSGPCFSFLILKIAIIMQYIYTS